MGRTTFCRGGSWARVRQPSHTPCSWWLPWTRPYWYLFNFSAELGVATHVGYSWWVPALSAITTVITIPIVEALERSGLPKIEGAIW